VPGLPAQRHKGGIPAGAGTRSTGPKTVLDIVTLFPVCPSSAQNNSYSPVEATWWKPDPGTGQ
jgi:hypothetical protein